MKSQVLQGFMIILQLIAGFEFISTVQFTINFINYYCLKSHLFHLFLYSLVKLSCLYANVFKQRGNHYIRTVHLDTIKVLLPTDAQNNCFKRIFKFTLKQLQHFSMLSPLSGSLQFELAKVTFVKTVH